MQLFTGNIIPGTIMNTQSDDQDSNAEHRTAILVAAGRLSDAA